MSAEQPSQVLEQVNGGQFRFYRYAEPGQEPVNLLSVTSIRNLCGEGYQLVNWKMANLADAALGTMKRTVIGPRGGVKEVRQVWEYPSEFARMYADCAATDMADEMAQQGKIDNLRKWLREQADEPRNIAAVRGTLVHEAIEKNVQWDRIERPYVESAFARLSQKDRKKVKRAINEDDISFIRNSVRHYWDMRLDVPMLILAREVRVVNLSVGYAGTFDALVWLLGWINPETGDFIPLPDDKIAEAKALKGDLVTEADVLRIGGTIVLLDWKTSKGIHTDQVVQAHAYLAAEFAVTLKRDTRITNLLHAAMFGGLVHIRPNGWKLHLFTYEDEAVRAFYGSVAFARFLARYEEPDALFCATLRGASNEEDEEVTAA
jgi:hypothetical protein